MGVGGYSWPPQEAGVWGRGSESSGPIENGLAEVEEVMEAA